MARRSLRHVSRRGPSMLDLLGSMVRGSETRDDRSHVITAVAGLERGLERLLRSQFRRMKKSDYDRLFEGTGPFATMSGKIQMGYAMGIYGPRTRHDLEIFNEIRNVFAHAPHNVTFKNKHLMNRTKGLWVMRYDPEAEPGRDAFDMAMRHYFVPFSLVGHDRYKALPRNPKDRYFLP